MKTIVVTGGMGSGKSLLMSFLEQKGLSVFSSDQAVGAFLRPKSPCRKQLKELFPDKSFYQADGSFDKKQIAKWVFQDFEKKKKMERIIHPWVRQAFQKFSAGQKKKGVEKVFYEIPLISTDFLKSFDQSILLSCPINIRKQRLLKAGWEILDVERRLAFQLPDSKVKDQVDFVIDNSGSIKNMEKQMIQILVKVNVKTSKN